jgi:hypothetical protein
MNPSGTTPPLAYFTISSIISQVDTFSIALVCIVGTGTTVGLTLNLLWERIVHLTDTMKVVERVYQWVGAQQADSRFVLIGNTSNGSADQFVTVSQTS